METEFHHHLSRDTFLGELVEGLAAILESALGNDIAASCLSDIGLIVGVRADRDYKRALGIERSLERREFLELTRELLLNLYPTAHVLDSSDDRVQIEVSSPPAGAALFSGREFSEIGSSILGAIASINFGYGKVCKTSSGYHDGQAIQRITVFTQDTGDSRSTPGDEYYPEIVTAFGNVQTQLKVVEENRILREHLQESAAEYRDRNRQISALAAIASTVSQSLYPGEILSAGLRMLMDAIGVEVGAVFRMDDTTDNLEISHQLGIGRDEACQILFDHILPHSASPGGKRWDAILKARRHSPPDWRCNDFNCYATAPMLSKERPIGVVLILARLRRAFTPLEMELLELVASELGVGLENIRLYDYLAQQVKRLTNLKDISALLSRCSQLDEVLDLTSMSVTGTLGFDRVGIFLVNEDENSLERMRGTDEHGQMMQTDRLRIPLDPESGTLARAVLERRPLHALDLSQEADISLNAEEAAGLANLHISAFARVPLIAEGHVVGVISVDNMLHQRPITDEDLSMLMIFGNQVAIAVENARFTEAIQRSAEELRRVDSVRSQFVSMISHELRSPLHRIRNAASLVLDDDTGRDQRKRFSRMIIRSTDYLTAMVNNLLAQSRIEQSALRVEPMDVGAAALVRDLAQELRAATLPSEQSVQIDIPESLRVSADPSYLKLILVNLINNASKVSARDGRIEIRAFTQGRFAQFCVKDYGPGIPYEQQTQIFDRYVSFNRENVDSANRGVGLGLHICRNLVDAHGGRLWLHSEPGNGAEFWFSLPVAADPPEAAENVENSENSQPTETAETPENDAPLSSNQT